MFGYVKTDMPNMYVKDTILYKAMYCGLCKGIGKACGQKGRFTLTYDLAFLSVLLHNLKNIDVKIEKQRCILHTIRKRPIAVTDKLTERIGALNVILAHYKLNDDIIDNGKGRLKRAFLKGNYNKAKVAEPELDAIVNKYYGELRALELKKCDSIDMVSDPFGNIISEVVNALLEETGSEDVNCLSYNLGKWIYLIDALDDFEKDIKAKTYNVFACIYPKITTKAQLIEVAGNDIVSIFATILGEITRATHKLKYYFNHDLIDNVLLNGLREQTKQIMENKKCKKCTKS